MGSELFLNGTESYNLIKVVQRMAFNIPHVLMLYVHVCALSTTWCVCVHMHKIKACWLLYQIAMVTLHVMWLSVDGLGMMWVTSYAVECLRQEAAVYQREALPMGACTVQTWF